MKEWVKLYTEIIRDPDIGTLSWAHRGIWAALLALAGEIDDRDDEGMETGRLDTRENVAWYLRCSPQELDEALAEFIPREMIHEADGVLWVTHFPERQARPPSARPEAVSERVKRHRNKAKASAKRDGNEPETEVKRECNEDVTTLHRECNEPVTTLEKKRIDTEKNRKESDQQQQHARASPGPAPPAAAAADADADGSRFALVAREYELATGNLAGPYAQDRIREVADSGLTLDLLRQCRAVMQQRRDNGQRINDPWAYVLAMAQECARTGQPPGDNRARAAPRARTRDYTAGVCPRCGSSPCRCKVIGPDPPAGADLERAKIAFLRAQDLLRQYAIAAPFEHATVIGFSEDGERVRIAPEERRREWFQARPQLAAKARECGVEVVLDDT